MRRTWVWIVLLAAAVGGAVLIFSTRLPNSPDSSLKSLPVVPAQGFARASGPRQFIFPQDFGPHPEFQAEWWYFTGNLATEDGRHFGYQLTFFRRGLLPEQDKAQRASDWATNQVYMAHFTLTDVQGGQFHYFERFARGAAGLAGAEVEPVFQVWLDHWSVTQVSDKTYRLRAEEKSIALQVDLADLKGPVLEGSDGYSQKGPELGNASYYFSQTRLDSAGQVTIGGQAFVVKGESWMDHEFSTSALSGDQVGWDWFSLQLSDGSELMVYNLRREDGSVDPYSQGLVIHEDGTTRRLTQDDFRVTPLAQWKSPHSGANYPAGWRVEVPAESIELSIQPLLADQELRVSFIYWEGAVSISGRRGEQVVSGAGYVELTGYARSMQGLF